MFVKNLRPAAAVGFLLLFLVGAMTFFGAAEEKKGTITVKNWTNKDIYISIDGYNKGEVWKNCSETWTVPLGEHKVIAWYDDESIKKYITLTETYPDAVWEISQGDIE